MSGDLEPSPGDVLHVEARYDDTEATIVLDGEFDMAGVARFWGYVSAVLAPHPLSIAVDARGLTFIDSSALMALLRACDAATEAGRGVPCQPGIACDSAHRQALRARGSSVARVTANRLAGLVIWPRAPRAGGACAARRARVEIDAATMRRHPAPGT